MVIVDTEKCIGCGACEKDCLLSEIHVIEGKAVPNNKTCFNCGHCVAICPVGAVRPQTGEEEVVPMTAEEVLASLRMFSVFAFAINTFS